jgi:endonuclease/exonuclease/phosphatase family metal-dependent hydrolase
MGGRFKAAALFVIAGFGAVSCAYNNRVNAQDTPEAASTPYTPPAPVVDTTPPANVTSVLLTPGNQNLRISWEAPPQGDYKATRIYRAASALDLDSSATRTLICENCSDPVTDASLTNGQTYWYRLISYDQTGNAASGTTVSASPSNAAIACDNTADADCLQIATFNLEYFTSGFDGTNSASRQTAKQTGVANVILNNGLDIVALQEIKDASVFTSWVASHLGSDWTYLLASSGCSARVAYVYKRSLVKLVSQEELSASPFNNGDWDGCLRRPLQAVFQAKHSDRQFRLINVHLKALTDSTACATRQSQADDLSAYLSSTNTTPTLLLGDLNDEVKAGVGICTSVDTLNAIETNSNVKFLTQSPTLDTTRFTNIPYSSTIDHLVVNSTFEAWLHAARGSWTADIIEHGDTQISDHQPALLWIKLR